MPSRIEANSIGIKSILCMAMTPGLGGETRSKPRVALAQLYPGFRDEFWPDRQRF